MNSFKSPESHDFCYGMRGIKRAFSPIMGHLVFWMNPHINLDPNIYIPLLDSHILPIVSPSPRPTDIIRTVIMIIYIINNNLNMIAGKKESKYPEFVAWEDNTTLKSRADDVCDPLR
jgi:hypothetical protein